MTSHSPKMSLKQRLTFTAFGIVLFCSQFCAAWQEGGGTDSSESEENYETDTSKSKGDQLGLIGRSKVVFDVRPIDAATNMAEMERVIRSIQADGIQWGESQVLPVAFGVKKLRIACLLDDKKVTTEWIEDGIAGRDDLVQSVDIVGIENYKPSQKSAVN
ncbi:EF-1 guanine nucleotide exchange domain-containing protein [Ditylenchus destructor]|nr:EF-1 guanine nucleotide exchange domain-containing protein [Ditylenchus destructor]